MASAKSSRSRSSRDDEGGRREGEAEDEEQGGEYPHIYTAFLSQRFQISPNWLLWLSIGATSTASSLGASPTAALFVGTLFLATWAALGVRVDQVIMAGVNMLLDVYFAQFVAVGTENIPDHGAVIFVCGPHSNQFLDPLVVRKGTKRDIRYIVAAKSLRRKDVGWLLRNTHPIPVERQQDVKAVIGEGRVRVDPPGGTRVLGVGTNFMEALSKANTSQGEREEGEEGEEREEPSSPPPPVCHIRIGGGPLLAVASVRSDTELELRAPAPPTHPSPSPSPSPSSSSDALPMLPYEMLPHISHGRMFEAVHAHLRGGGALGIFPEGGSHDQTKLLPLKAGVCVMALGAVAGKGGAPLVSLVPVGLNYFSGHKFNSRVVVNTRTCARVRFHSLPLPSPSFAFANTHTLPFSPFSLTLFLSHSLSHSLSHTLFLFLFAFCPVLGNLRRGDPSDQRIRTAVCGERGGKGRKWGGWGVWG